MKDLHQQFIKYGTEARKWMRKCELLLPEIYRRRIWKKKGYGSIYEYAAKLAGMSKEKARECLRIHKHIEDKPELIEIAEKKGLGAVRPVATIATQENAGFWAEKAESMTKNSLEVYVKECRPSTTSQPAKLQVSLNLKPELAKKLERFKQREDAEELLEKFLDQIEEKPEPVESESHYISAAIQKYIRARSQNRCEYPGCGRKAEIFHHTNRFAEHHCHDPDKIYHLCEGHERLAHLGLIENEHKSPIHWRVREKVKPGPIDLKVQQFRRNSTLPR